MSKSIVLLSGGLDSATLLYLANHLDFEKPIALSFDYGQRHKRELASALQLTNQLGVKHIIAKLPSELFLGSALTQGGGDVPHGHYAEASMSATIVPNRNAVFLSLAYALAVSTGALKVAIAAHAGDHPIYPDCRPEFLQSFANMEEWAIGTVEAPELWSPFADKTKAEIVETGFQLRVPWSSTWSCYEGNEVHCGQCGTCYERQEAFFIAGKDDPTIYKQPAAFSATQGVARIAEAEGEVRGEPSSS